MGEEYKGSDGVYIPELIDRACGQGLQLRSKGADISSQVQHQIAQNNPQPNRVYLHQR
jgi:hypothetical protein